MKFLWHVYVKSGMAFIPNVAQTEAEYYLDVDPVRTVNTSDINKLAEAIEMAMSAGNRKIPTPTRAEFPKPVILKPAKVKNWSAFVTAGVCFTIISDGINVEVSGTSRDENGDWDKGPIIFRGEVSSSLASEIAKVISVKTRADEVR